MPIAKMGGGLKNKAFTLIELLAIIVILAIIAVITVPIILNVIDNAKKGSIIDSAYGYKDAVDKYYVTKLMEEDFELNGSYFVSNGKLSGMDIPISGIGPTSGRLTYKNGELIDGILVIDDYVVTINDNGVTATKGTSPINIVTTGDVLYASSTDEGRYIYRGSNPNNYIWLDENGDKEKQDDELYRIISYESDGTIKVIRNNSIGYIAWDSRTSETEGPRKNTNNSYCNYEVQDTGSGNYFGCNAWSNQNNTYLNGNLLQDSFYYKYYPNNTTNDLSQNVENSLTVTTDSSLNTYLNGDWLNSTSLDNYIIEHEYNVGGIYYLSTYTGGDKGLLKEKEEQNMYTWSGKVGLMNITDMVESSINISCTSVYSNYSHNSNYWYDSNGDGTKTQNNSNWPCTNGNWLFKGITEWTISPLSSNRRSVWIVYNSGHFSSDGAYSSGEARPSFYLKPTIVLDGVGTEQDPFVIEKF